MSDRIWGYPIVSPGVVPCSATVCFGAVVRDYALFLLFYSVLIYYPMFCCTCTVLKSLVAEV